MSITGKLAPRSTGGVGEEEEVIVADQDMGIGGVPEEEEEEFGVILWD
jgi:hypothetical protein